MYHPTKLSVSLAILFILVTIVDGAYVLFIQRLPDVTINSWFVIFPFLCLFYLLIAGIGSVGIYLRQQWGFTCAYITLLFGSLSCAISYTIIYNTHPFYESIFVYLLILNFLVMCLFGVINIAAINKQEHQGHQQPPLH